MRVSRSTGVEFQRRYEAVLAKWPSGVSSLVVSSRFGSTRVNVCGAADGRPTVLLSGAGATSTVWFANVSALVDDGHRVYAIDMIGDVGASVATNAPSTTGELVDWLSNTLDGLGVRAASFVGHSYGAMVGLAFALASPGRVRNLVLLDPTSCFAGMAIRYLLHALPVLIRPSAERQSALLAWESGVGLDPEWIALTSYGTEHCPTAKKVVPRRPSREALAALSMPTTVVLAPDSRVHDVRAVEQGVRRSLPEASVTILPSGSHHGLPIDPADDVNAAIIAGLSVGPGLVD